MRYFIFLLALLSYQLCSAQKIGKPYYIHSIYFEGGSYYIDDQQKQELSDFIDAIPNREDYVITVHSHTDNIGSVEYNEWLSEMRSEAAIAIIVLHNINRELISIEDFGELNPVYDNSTYSGRMKNRRVDIVFKKLEM